MIVTTGRHITIEVGDFRFDRTCETPGIVTLRSRSSGEIIKLPVNVGERSALVAAYNRACEEEIEYRKSEVESARDR